MRRARVVRPWDKTYSCYGSRQTLILPSNSVLHLIRTAHARFLSDTKRCPMFLSKSVCLGDQGLMLALCPPKKTTETKRTKKHGALRPQKPLRFIRDGEVGGSVIFIPNTYSLHCHHQNDSALRWGSCVSHFNVSLTVWAKSQDSVHKPIFLKRKESRSGSNRGPSAYQPGALPLGHTGSQESQRRPFPF